MAMPKKGSKELLLDDVYYRYMVKEEAFKGVKYPEDKKIALIVQQVAEKPGNVMRAMYPYGLEITPAFVCKEVCRALKAGWDPSKRGGAFDLPKEIENGK